MTKLFSISALLVAFLIGCGPSAEQKKLVADIEAAATALENADKASAEKVGAAVNGAAETLKMEAKSDASKAKVSELNAAIEASKGLPTGADAAKQAAAKFKKTPGKVEEMKKELDAINGQVAERGKNADEAVAKINGANDAAKAALAEDAKAPAKKGGKAAKSAAKGGKKAKK